MKNLGHWGCSRHIHPCSPCMHAHTRMHASSLAQVYWPQKWTLGLGRNFRQRKAPVRNTKWGRSIVLEKESLEVWFEGIQKGFLLERKGKIPCTGAEDGKGGLEGEKRWVEYQVLHAADIVSVPQWIQGVFSDSFQRRLSYIVPNTTLYNCMH